MCIAAFRFVRTGYKAGSCANWPHAHPWRSTCEIKDIGMGKKLEKKARAGESIKKLRKLEGKLWTREDLHRIA